MNLIDEQKSEIKKNGENLLVGRLDAITRSYRRSLEIH